MSNKFFTSAISVDANWKKAAEAVASKLKRDLDGRACDLLCVFVSETYEDFDAKAFVSGWAGTLAPRVMIGCNASGVIGTSKEVEMKPAISAIAMRLPDIKIQPFFLSSTEIHSLKNGAALLNELDIYPTDKPHFIVLGEPSSANVNELLSLFNDGYKKCPVIGGLASGGVANRPNWLALNGEVYEEGAVGAALLGDIEFEIIVSQGCRPIGKPYVITKAEDNVLYELAGRPALEVVRDVVQELTYHDKQLAQTSLFVGLVMNENKEAFHRGDFLIRNIIGFDPEAGTLVVGEELKVGHTLQFQLRDAQTSEEDLKTLLGTLKETGDVDVRGALLISCCGRGEGLYGKPNHDIQMIQSLRGPFPLCGFFANGEIGPVGPKNYIHGYTSSLAIIR